MHSRLYRELQDRIEERTFYRHSTIAGVLGVVMVIVLLVASYQ